MQMYTIFKNECKFILTDSLESRVEDDFYYWESFNLNGFLKDCEQQNKSAVIYLFHPDLNFLWKEFKNKFTVVEAGGGVVQNNENEILFIFRNGKWDLPKGKVEEGETIPETAIREVEEECGITNLILNEFSTTTYHIYEENDREILKISHWYKMAGNAGELKPQLEEGITEVIWKNKEEVKMAMQNTYPNIKLLIDNI